jgi:hypothetical protein
MHFSLCLRLAERGETLQVLTSQGGLDGRRFPFTVHHVMRDWSWTDLPRLARFIRRCRPDAITLLYSGWIYNDHPMITFAPTMAKRIFPSVPFVTMLAIEEGPNWGGLPSRAIRKAVQFWAGSKTVDYVFGTLLRDSDSVIAWSQNHLARFSELSPHRRAQGTRDPAAPIDANVPRGQRGDERTRARTIECESG